MALIRTKASMDATKERRKEKRRMVQSRRDVLIFAHGDNDPNKDAAHVQIDGMTNGTVLDVSLTGLGITANQKVGLKKEIVLEFQGADGPVKVKGKVVWCQRMPLSGNVIKPDPETDMVWRLGIQVKIDEEEIKKLMEVLVETL